MSRLAAVNACLFVVGTIQCSRILQYNKELTGSYAGAIRRLAGQAEGSAKKLEREVKQEARQLEKANA